MRSGRGTSLLQASMLSMAVAVALVLVWLASDARAVTTVPEVDENEQGNPYVAGELLVSYDRGASSRRIDEVAGGSGARVAEEIPVVDAQLLTFPAIKREQSGQVREEKLRKAKEALQNRLGVEHVDYNYLRTLYYEADDPRFKPDIQWDLFQIRAPAAWDETLGNGARVAVVDSGIDADHPDLESKIAVQKDLVDNDDVAQDSVGHGTHVAGTTGAATNNGQGVAATCPGCKLLVARVGDSQGISDVDIAQGIYWSVNNRARVINLSLGGEEFSWALKHAVDYAWEHRVVVVASAGNDDTDTPSYPAAYEHAISVVATNKSNNKSPFSNYGSTVDVAAPGVRILSTVPGGSYERKSGTSMASPHVAALAGLLASQNRSAPEIRRRIEATATDLGADGKDRYFGWGLINAKKAVRP